MVVAEATRVPEFSGISRGEFAKNAFRVPTVGTDCAFTDIEGTDDGTNDHSEGLRIDDRLRLLVEMLRQLTQQRESFANGRQGPPEIIGRQTGAIRRITRGLRERRGVRHGLRCEPPPRI